MKFAMSQQNTRKRANKILDDYLSGKSLKVAVVIRVSTNREEQKTSIINQKRTFQRMIEENGWELYDFYVDIKSGTKENRKGLKQLIQDATDQKFDLILAKELSRLARNVPLAYKLKDIVIRSEIHIKTLDGAIDTLNNKRDDMFGFYAVLYEKESQNTSDRIKQSFRISAQEGEFNGSIPPYGYYAKDKVLYIRNDYTPDIVRKIFSSYIEGKGHDSIAKDLDNDGVPTPSKRGNKWQGSTIKKILMNPHYIGMLVQCRDTKPTVDLERQPLPEEEFIINKNTHEPIINPEIYWTAQELLISRRRIRPQQKKHLFTNIIFCQECGRGMHYKKNINGYICGNYNKHGSKACSPNSIKETQVSSVILNDLKTFIKFDRLLPNLNPIIEAKTSKNNKELVRLENEISKLNYDLIEVTKTYSRKEITLDLYNSIADDTKERINHLNKEKQKIQKSCNKINDEYNIGKIKQEIDKYLKFEHLTSEIIHYLVQRIEVTESGGLKIFYGFRFPS